MRSQDEKTFSPRSGGSIPTNYGRVPNHPNGLPGCNAPPATPRQVGNKPELTLTGRIVYGVN
ncbi:hypothetical protein GCM10027511_19470 [Hymenobacter humi]